MQAPAELARLFRERGLKLTPQRECIFSVLHGDDQHPSAEAVFERAQARMPTLSLKTVYQTLNDLTEMGQINQLDLGTGAARFDPNVEPHHHLVCVGCGAVRDLYLTMPPFDVPASALHGFEVSGTEVVFRGLCPACRHAACDQQPRSPTGPDPTQTNQTHPKPTRPNTEHQGDIQCQS